jgi:hypothetical protein
MIARIKDRVASLRRWWSKPAPTGTRMQTFSEERLQQLRDEQTLVIKALAHLMMKVPVYARMHGNDLLAGTMNNLKMKRLELEAMIQALDEFLHS